jgi:subtilisin family serine protease
MRKGDKGMKVWCLNTIFVILNGFCRKFERVLEGKKGQIKSTLIETIVILSLISIVSVSASAQVTTVSIGETSVSSCNFITIPIMINVSSVDAPDGLGAATINLTYDPSVCVVTEAKNSSFDSFTSSHLCTNTSGYVRMIAYQTGPTGVGPGLVKFADVRLHAVGGDENISRLNLIVDVLKNNAGTAVPYTIVNGAFKTVPMTPVMPGKQGKLSAELVKAMKESSPDDKLRVIVQSDFIITPSKLDQIKGIETEILVIKDRMIIIDATKEQIGKIAGYGWVSLIDLDVLGEAQPPNTEGNDVINRNQEIFKSPISDIEYEIIKLFPEETVMYKDKNGTIYSSKQEIFDNEISELSIDPNLLKLDRKLRDIIKDGKVNDTVPVIVAFLEQPAHDISVEVKAEYEPRFEEITAPTREIYERIKPMLGTEEEFFSKKISEVINTEQDLLTDEGKRVLNETRILLDQEVMLMRQEIFTQSAPLVDEIQAPVIAEMENNGCEMKYSGKIYNSVTANVPVSYLNELSKESSIAMIWYDYVFNATLDISIDAIDADYWWGQGYTGGAWDAAVVDTGIDGSHPALNVYAAGVFHSSAVSDPAYNDNQFSTDDLQGHGTHCAGIIASDDSTYRGVAYGMDALINAKAGWRNIYGTGSMRWSDAMEAIDWAILHCADDADAISFSFGGSPGANGDTGFCHYMDAVIFALVTQVAISAGNDGPSSTTVREPGSAYNVITVGNIDDKNSESRSDDSIAYSSSRGPTGDGRIKPDICAPGTSIMSCNNRWEESGQSDFVSKSGTSMAAPHIAGSILLILDYVATQWDAKAVKALLLTTAEDKGAAGPDNDYGYGYEDLQHAYFHRDDVHRGSLEDKPEGDVEKFYKGYAYGGDTATLVWNRHVTYNAANYPAQYLDLSDLDLRMYDESNNNLIDSSSSSINNVEQVESDATYSSSIIKIEPFGTYPTGITSENYALGTEEGFTEVDPPTLSVDISIPGTVSSGYSFTASVTVTNNGYIKAHGVSATLNLPSGFSIIAGSNPQTLGIINGGSSKTAIWTVQAPSVSSSQSYALSTDADSSSYGDTYAASDSNSIVVVLEEKDDVAVFSAPLWFVDKNGAPLWFVDINGDHLADDVFGYGFAGATPLVGDINQDGTDDIAVFCDGLWFVDTNGDHLADDVFGYGFAGATPLVGDINQDGTDDIAVFCDGLWFVDTNGDHIADDVFGYGFAGATPLVGDINQDGTDDIAVFCDGLWFVDTNGDHLADDVFGYGFAGATPLVGDIG